MFAIITDEKKKIRREQTENTSTHITTVDKGMYLYGVIANENILFAAGILVACLYSDPQFLFAFLVRVGHSLTTEKVPEKSEHEKIWV